MKIACDYGGMPEVPREDYDEEKSDKAYKGCFWSLVASIVTFVIVSVLLLTSCTTTEVVEVEKVRTDTTYITKWQRDSVWLHDSIRVTERGDTVRIERWHTQWRDRLRVDTVYRVTHDTIPAPYPETEYVEKELSWWQKLRLWLGNIVLLALLGVVGYYGVKLWRVYHSF